MAWAVPKFSKKKVNEAGEILVREESDFSDLAADEREVAEYESLTEYFDALDVINNWRSSHNFPLNPFQNGLRKKGKQVDAHCLIAQRIKRLSSIELKLRRFGTTTLSQMQDIGGCRAIVSSVDQVRALCKLYAESEMKHKLHHMDDYLNHPKNSGYRGVHLIYRYHSDRKTEYNTLLIEMQLRSQLQHAWATGVETAGAFMQQALKSSLGEKEWLRFFALMGTAIAVRENSPPVPQTPRRYSELVKELRDHARALDITNKLAAFGTALEIFDQQQSKDNHYYLMEVDHINKTVTVTGFKLGESELATSKYLDAEKKVKQRSGADAVLVSVDSMAALQRAYPNYFLDTRVFVDLMTETLKSTRIPRRRLSGLALL
jgi:hypothetical protein